MSDPRAEAFAAIREAETAIDGVRVVLTLGAIDEIQRALLALAASQRRALEWIDAIEI